MKKLVGQRSKVTDPSIRGALAFVSLCTIATIPPRKIVFPGDCKKCGGPADISLFEDIETGQIWLEGPDNCPTCGYKIVSDSMAETYDLSQEMIEKLFGSV
jgi:hypothetical protein